VQITVDAQTLLGWADRPGMLAGFGPVSAALARAIAAGGTWRALLTDPESGEVLHTGTSSYTPPAALARHIRARDQRCRFPGCGRTAARDDLDHTIPWPQGPTGVDNLGPLCRPHHRVKQHRAVRLVQDRAGRFTWTLPTGHRYQVEVPAVGSTRRDQWRIVRRIVTYGDLPDPHPPD
jgi:hypothetical protein